MLKSERTKREASKAVGSKRKALALDDEDLGEHEIESPMDTPGAAASVEKAVPALNMPVAAASAVPASFDMQAAFAQFMSTMSGQPLASVVKVPEVPQQENKTDARNLEKARLMAEKNAVKAEKEALKAQKKEAAKATKAAEYRLALAARTVPALGSLNEELAALKIPKDTPEVIADPVKQAQRNIADMMKASKAVIDAMKKKDFVSNAPTLDFDQRQMKAAVGEARNAMKKLQDYVQLVDA
jgi:hypothetical protein